ncbi:MAG: DUF362 domain-containing protein [Planctomycetota bacterium]|jgi:uncharacterized protein (DUF362 family)|nr:DUF362 domain-containing protein [Planctomycetota bacterium]
MTEKSKVAIVIASADTIHEDISRAFELADAEQALPSDAPVILKDNITWHKPFLSANTTPWQLEGSVKWLIENNRKMIAVHNDTVVTNPHEGLENLKLQKVYSKYQIDQFFVNDPQSVSWGKWRPQNPMPWLDLVYPEGPEFPEMFHGKSVLHLPTVKTHVYTTTTGAVKNSFGGLLNTRRHYCHTYIHGVLADLIAVQQELHKGIFAIADGTLAGNGAGPRTMYPVEKNVLIASSDCVAMDAVAARLMGFDPMSIGYLRESAERELGKVDESEIELVGDYVMPGWGFSVKNNFASSVGNSMWFGPLRYIQDLFFKTPLVNLFIKGSSVYHDDYWWEKHGKERMQHIAETSQWGKLFSEYLD